MTKAAIHAYMAALIDGEGCITIGKSSGKYYFPLIVIVQRPPEALQWVHQHFGGALRPAQTTVRACRHCAQPLGAWRWTVQGRESVLAVLRAVRPYLRLKGRNADLVAELCHTITRGGKQWKQVRHLSTGRPGRPKALTPDEWAHRARLFAEVRALNRQSHHRCDHP